MTIAHVGSTGITTTTAARGTTSTSVSFPASSVAAGRLAIIMAETKSGTWGTAPSGFTLIANATGGGGSGADQGAVRIGVWYKILDGSESGSVTVASTSGTQLTAVMSVYSKTAAAWITPLATVTGSDNSHGTSTSATLGAWQSILFTSDTVVFAYAANTDATGTVTPTFTQAGITFGSITARNRWPGSDGNDGAIFSWDIPVTGGGTLTAPVFGTGWSSSNSGVVAAIRLREGASSAISTLSENFDDNSINTSIWAQNYGVTSETGGRGRIETSTTYAAFMTSYAYSLDSTGVFAQIFPAAANGATTEAYTAMWLTSGNQAPGTDFGFYYEATTGVLNCTIRTGYSQDGSTVNLTYNATDHAYWRLRLSGANILWETSPDGSTWTQRRSAAAPAYVASTVDFALMLESHRAEGTTNFVEIDNVNLSGVAEVTGAAALSGTGSLVTSAVVIRLGSSVLSGTGSLSTSAVVTTQGVWARSATGTLVTSAVVTKLGSSVLNGVGTLTTSGTVSRLGAATFSGQLQLTSSASVVTSGTATLTGQLSNTSIGTVTRFGVVTLNGTGSLTVSGTPTRFGTATLTGEGILVPVDSNTITVVNVSLNGTSNLTTSGSVTTTGMSVLNGAGILNVVGQNTVPATVMMTGAGTLQTSGNTTVRAASVLSGVGTLTTMSVLTTTGSATLNGVGTLVTQGIIGAVPPEITMTGSGSLTAIGQNTVRAATVLSGQAILAAVDAENTTHAATVLTGQITLAATSTVTVMSSSMLTGVTGLTVSGDTILGPVQAILSGQGSLTVAGQAIRVASTQLNAEGSMNVSGSVTTTGVTVLNAQGSMEVIGTRGVTGSVTMNGEMHSTVEGFIPAVITGLAELAAALSMEIIGRIQPPWTLPYIEFNRTDINTGDLSTDTVSGVDRPDDELKNTTEMVASGINSIEGG